MQNERKTPLAASDRQILVNTLRFLAIDAVEQAQSGHPGMPMGMADIAEVLWNDFLKHNPKDPNWFNRDRFVLSNGHGSMLLYALLHLSGYDLSIDDIKNFRQLGSKTPGHPEYGLTPGVETTTGPLGQGFGNAVGMAIAEAKLAAEFNRPNFPIVDHHTYVFVGDGCLMEGISHEVASLAGNLALGKLITIYDDNDVSIDGHLDGVFADHVAQRFRSYGWHVVDQIDGHDADAINQQIRLARQEAHQPSLLMCRTHIGYGAPTKQDTAGSHGSPLGADEIKATREQLDWPHAPFDVPSDVKEVWDATTAGEQAQQQWQTEFDGYAEQHPELAEDFNRRVARQAPADWGAQCERVVAYTQAQSESMATRKASRLALNVMTEQRPELLGGSADLTGSNCTFSDHSQAINHVDSMRAVDKPRKKVAVISWSGNYLHYGVREFGMTAIMNGVVLHGGLRPYGGTFLVFSDYARNGIRLAAMMGAPTIFVMTHDSIGLGEDGPTHQPIEHLASLRLIPNLNIWRPCDATETMVAWQAAINSNDTPTILALSRQALPSQKRNDLQLPLISKGGYILCDGVSNSAHQPGLIIIATGSEVTLAVAAHRQLSQAGHHVRVVSMPCVEAFGQQSIDYQTQVLPADVKARLVIEAGVTDGWYRWVGSHGKVMGIDRFGESAPAERVFEHVGLTVERVVEQAQQLLSSIEQ
ncbi:MAG: transketolase [Gammaproteobacteria bacterium]|nr:transketolase [Gammaproteobacteria bacterium]